MLQSLGNSTIFSVMDVAAAFWQIPLDESSAEKTAFTTRKGHWHWVRMPMGLKNAPSTWQRFLNTVIGDALYDYAVAYLDDILVHSRTFKEHLVHLEKILRRIRRANITLKIENSQLFKSSAKYVGYICSAAGVQPDPAKVQAILDTKMPHHSRYFAAATVNFLQK
jgi:hypothetical protein